jgi:biotin carboxyl carrier protein
MKMENTIAATRDGVVKSVPLNEKTLVSQDDLVVEFK